MQSYDQFDYAQPGSLYFQSQQVSCDVYLMRPFSVAKENEEQLKEENKAVFFLFVFIFFPWFASIHIVAVKALD